MPPGAGWSSRRDTTPTGYQQAKTCESETEGWVVSGGSSTRHRSCTYGQRGANRHPRMSGVTTGGRPTMATSGVWLGSSSFGIDRSSASV